LPAVFIFAFGAAALAQGYKPQPSYVCSDLVSGRFGGQAGSALAHELLARVAAAREACEQAAKDQPREGWVFASLARVRALTGDADGALEAARRGAELKHPMAQVLLGVMLAEKGDYGGARELFLTTALRGSLYADYNLGAMYAKGWGPRMDEADAATAWFLKAAERGDPLAMQLLAQRYDKPRAAYWLQKAAEAMYPELQREPLRIAMPIDAPAIVAWYRDKAKSEPWAQAYMGMLYESGQWVPQDNALAASWYRRAAEAGHVLSQGRLVRFYREGRGVPKDMAEATRWWNEMGGNSPALSSFGVASHQALRVRRCEQPETAETGADACDRLAADRYDPNRVTPGVDSSCMRQFAEPAVLACRAAVEQSPSTVRYRSQVARALAHTGRFEEARKEAGAAAAAGSAAAMVLLGVMHQRGLGAAKDEAAALAWYRKAAEAGDPRAPRLVYILADNGMGVAKSSPEAEALLRQVEAWERAAVNEGLRQSAEAGDARGQFSLAARLEREKKYDEALKWYERAAAQGFGPAELNLAHMYENGIGVTKDTAQARRRYRKMAELGDPDGRFRTARLAAQAGDFGEALKYYERGARDGEWRSTLDLGELYEHGRGVKQDLKRAISLYEKFAERSAWARFKLGVLYMDIDPARAHAWLKRSAADGNARAHNNLGWMHEKDLGIKADQAAAREHYLSGHRRGSPEAKGNLERIFADAVGSPSVDDYRTAAQANISSAQYRLGMMYRKGENVARDDKAALDWLLRAAHQNHPEARKEAAQIHYEMGNDAAATMLGHEAAARRFAAKLDADGQHEAAAQLRRYLAQPPRFPAAPTWAQGIATAAGEDESRTMFHRGGGVPLPKPAAADPAIADVYDIIRWFPGSDGKPKPK